MGPIPIHIVFYTSKFYTKFPSKALHSDLVAAGRRPKLQRLDNECTEPLKQFFVSENITYQLVPPGVHRRNPAERAGPYTRLRTIVGFFPFL
jgi:hypothetical protein